MQMTATWHYIKQLPNRKDIRKFISESWSLGWPMMIIMFFEFLTGFLDIFVAGRISKEIQAAYGFVIQLYFVFIIVGNAFSIGAVAVVSQIFTSKNGNRLAESIYSTIMATIALGIALGISGIFLTPVIIELLRIPSELKPIVIPLGRIYAAGVLFHCLLINTNAILRACKKVKASLKTMAFVCLSNTVLIFFIVFHTNTGFRGIALATAISVCLGSILNMYYTWPLMAGLKRFSVKIVKTIVNISWPSALLQGLWQINSMVIFLILSALPKHSIEVLAALSAGVRIESAIFLPAMAFNMANAVVVGNLLGEGRKEDAFRGGLVTTLISIVVVSFITVVVLLNAKWIAPYLSNNSIVIAECITYIYISMISEPFMATWVVLGGALNGAGDTKGMMIVVGLVVWLIRVPLTYIFVILLGFGAVSVWWTMNLSQFLMALFIFRRYWNRKWLAHPYGYK
ncbi:MAG: MATE family efflux transporter [Proteobacteria bacterium]|nr:MATE family efflux transporter [Pseudomonadota bacterium]